MHTFASLHMIAPHTAVFKPQFDYKIIRMLGSQAGSEQRSPEIHNLHSVLKYEVMLCLMATSACADHGGHC